MTDNVMVMGNEAEGLIAERLQSKTYSVKYATRWYPWGIQSPHTSAAMGRGRGGSGVSSDLNSGKKVRVFHWGGCSG